MPFIGNQPALSYTSFAKQDFTTSATTAYTLSQPVANANEIALFINFVRQEPTTAYSASGTSLTLTSATSASDDMYAIFLGKAVQTVNPPAGSVGASQITDGSITSAKTNFTVPTITRLTSGTGTYTLPSGAKYIIVEMAGGGAGGGGGGTGSWGVGTAGGNTTFGTSLHTAGGGNASAQPWSGAGGLGGANTLGAGATEIINQSGTRGGGIGVAATSGTFFLTGMGGTNALGGGASSVTYFNGGGTGITNSGGGGSGGGQGNASNAYPGGGGGAGGYMKFLISSPSASYAYAIGAGGTGGAAGTGTNAAAGGAGGSGVIIIQEFYN
jgi:hypothetical protein